MTDQYRFLETIGCIGGDVLIPIADIKVINVSYGNNTTVIKIKMKCGEMEFHEHFKTEERAGLRYEEIKTIIGAK